MRKIITLAIALGLTAMSGSITLVRADCAYHKSQSALDSAKTTKAVATVPAADKTVAKRLQTVQSDKPDQPAPQMKN